MPEPRKQSLQELSQHFMKLVAKVAEDPKNKAKVTAFVEASRARIAAVVRTTISRLTPRK
jgi:hypothetical protein